MADKIRVGIVGATVTPGGSGWGALAHVPALQALPEFELEAVCTAHEDTAAAAAAKFDAEIAFADFDRMLEHPYIDLVVVCVRVPGHHDLVMRALRAGKPTFCEWPLGANLAEADEMLALAEEKSLRTFIGLQARSDPTIRYAKELIDQGYLGEVLTAHLSIVSQSLPERGSGRVWQRVRAYGANPLTIPGGHSMDVACYLLGEVAEVSARTATRTTTWRDTDLGVDLPVDAPDTIAVGGRLTSGAELAIRIATVPTAPNGFRLDMYGRDGTLSLVADRQPNIGPGRLLGAQGGDALAELPVPDRFTLIPEGIAAGPPRNVAQAYRRLAEAFDGDGAFDPDFAVARSRHVLIDAIERSAEQGRAITLP